MSDVELVEMYDQVLSNKILFL